MHGGDVEELLNGLWLVVTELVHLGSTIHAKPECRDYIGVADHRELVALLGETSILVPQGFALHLPATLYIPGVTRPHIRALKVAGKDLLEIFPTIDRVSGQMVEPTSGRVSQVNGEELDDEKVIVRPACPALEAVVLQPNARIGFTVIHDDVIGCSKMLREARVVHIAPKCLGP
jgi:hypothetical protein